jgi:hypothetical protein
MQNGGMKRIVICTLYHGPDKMEALAQNDLSCLVIFINTCCLFALCNTAVAGMIGSDKELVCTAFFNVATASECAPLLLEANTIPGLSSSLILESNCTACIFLHNIFQQINVISSLDTSVFA